MIVGPTICISGGIIDKEDAREINEDLVIKGKNYAILMDGATGLGGPRLEKGLTNAEWFVKTCGTFLQENLNKSPDIDLSVLIRNCIIYAKEKIKEIENERNFSLQPHEEPSSTIILIREFSGKTDILTLGDSVTMIKTKDKKFTVLRDFNLSKLDNLTLNKMQEIAKERDISIIEARYEDEIKAQLINNRNKKNSGKPDGYWILSLNEKIVENAKQLHIPSNTIEKIVCVSDGFNYNILGLNEKEFFEKCLPYTINTLANKITELEELDSNCNNYPRFKKRDDCSGFIWIPDFKHH